VGISVAAARDIALDVFKANFLTLSGVAEQTARDRAERITREYLEKLERCNPGGLANIQDPDMLQAIYTAQKGYACSGEEDLESVLIDLLVDRSGQKDRDLKTLILNEAIACLPRLTNAQRKGITFCFLMRHNRYAGPLALEPFYKYIHSHLTPFADISTNADADYRYIQSAGLASQSTRRSDLEHIFQTDYYGFFNSGFTVEQLPVVMRDYICNSSCFVQCLRNPDALQFNVRSRAEVRSLQSKMGYAARRGGILSIGEMKGPDVLEDIVSHAPAMAEVFDHWDRSGLRDLELTIVGIAIGHAYWRRITSEATPLDVWLR
jgi:hypothetical protein